MNRDEMTTLLSTVAKMLRATGGSEQESAAQILLATCGAAHSGKLEELRRRVQLFVESEVQSLTN